MDFNETTMERLTFIKSLYRTGVDQAQKPQPLASTAVLTFHDAVELFLHLSAEELDAHKGDNLMDYWNDIKQKSGIELTSKAGIDRLRDARNSLKHSANRPDELEIESFRNTVQNFFEENTPKVFGIEFSEISLASLVKFEDTREYLFDAQELYNNNEVGKAMGCLSVAHQVLFEEYDKRARYELDYRPFPHFNVSDISFPDVSRSSVETINDTLHEVEIAIKYLCIGVDYRKYSKFETITPSLIANQEDNEFGRRRPYIENYDESIIDDEEFNFCFQFVIELALSLQEVEFNYSENPENQTDSAFGAW